ncbi:MAG: hypothetical protein ACQEXV_22250 [Bacillota bacterium]
MSEEMRYWKLNALADELGCHFTTVNRWFNMLETRGIHYVEKAPDSTRVYTDLDLKIGQYINDKRKKSWNFDGILAQMVDDPTLELRPFPNGSITPGNELSTDVTKLSEAIHDRMSELLQQQEDHFNERIQALYQGNQQLRLEMRQKDITDMITNNRITNMLRLEALKAWAALPDSERLIKKGLFRKEEDLNKKEQFITQYEMENYADRLLLETANEPNEETERLHQEANDIPDKHGQ